MVASFIELQPSCQSAFYLHRINRVTTHEKLVKWNARRKEATNKYSVFCYDCVCLILIFFPFCCIRLNDSQLHCIFWIPNLLSGLFTVYRTFIQIKKDINSLSLSLSLFLLFQTGLLKFGVFCRANEWLMPRQNDDTQQYGVIFRVPDKYFQLYIAQQIARPNLSVGAWVFVRLKEEE